MSGRVPVVLGLEPPEREAIGEALAASASLEVRARARDVDELIELAGATTARLALVSAGLPGLDAGSLRHLAALAGRVAGVAASDRAAARLEGVGVAAILRLPLEPAALTRLVADSAAGASPATAAGEESEARGAGRAGSLLAVVGSKGSPGASELAASLAARVARAHRVLLLELDGEGGAGLAARVGLGHDAGSLRDLVHALAADVADPVALLPRWVTAAARGWPAVLPGLPDPQRDLAGTLTSRLSQRLLEVLTARYALVVCDVGPRLRQHGGGDLAARLHREVVLAADAQLVVLGGRVQQLHAGVAQLDLLLGELAIVPESLRVVVNGQPGLRRGGATGAGSALASELAHRGLTLDARLPFDGRGLRAALRRGLPLAVAAPRGRYARALSGLAAELLVPGRAHPARRKRRLLLADARRRIERAEGEVALPWRAA